MFNLLIFFTGLLIIYLNGGVSSQMYSIPSQNKEKDSGYWYSLARDDIDFALNRKLINNVAKNVIIFLGDGMGITVTTAGRIFKGQKKGFSGEEEFLVWEKFPNAAFSKTYNVDKQVPDSAATATSYLGGVKANYFTVGVTAAVKKGDCKGSLLKKNQVKSILQWSQDAGKDTGIVTTTRITHATPAALYAHSAHRYWECDEDMKNQTEYDVKLCKDIGRQLVEEYPGKDVNVILAGGRRQLGSSLPGDTGGCLRSDKLNLVDDWLNQKNRSAASAIYVTNNQQLNEINPQDFDYLMGLFAGGHMPYAYERNDGPEGSPSLNKMTETAIRRLQRNSKGFFLLVEGGRIDHALHDTKPHPALLELLDFEDSVQTALRMTNNEDTLIIVTADHSHVMTMNGYPDRGNDIFGKTTYEYVTDGMPYTTLMFTTGFATNFTWTGEKVLRANLTEVDTTDMHFMPQASVPTKFGYETHGGEDVGIYATGPMSHLFHRVHEQSYIAHVMGYASCVGPYVRNCQRPVDQPSYEVVTTEATAGAGVHFMLKLTLVANLVLLINI